MDLSKRTYRILSAFTLILLLGTLVAPAGISAAMLWCDSNMDVTTQMADCCTQADASHQGHTAMGTGSDGCSHEQICEQSFSADLSHAPATVQLAKELEAAPMKTVILAGIQHRDSSPASKKAESVHLQHAPPLFLLNSTFLN